MKLKLTLSILLLFGALAATSCSSDHDDRHKYFQAALSSQDAVLEYNAYRKLGLTESNGQLGPKAAQFLTEHREWMQKNEAWVNEHKDVNKAQEYVRSHAPK